MVRRLPGYASELNPVEALWANLKEVELANLAADTLAEVAAAAEHGIQRIRPCHWLAYRSCATAACPCGEQDHPREWRSPLGQAGPEVELVLGGVVDRPDAIGSWRQGLHVRHGPGIVEGVPWRQADAVGVAGAREVGPIADHLIGQAPLVGGAGCLELLVGEQVGDLGGVEGAGREVFGERQVHRGVRSANS